MISSHANRSLRLTALLGVIGLVLSACSTIGSADDPLAGATTDADSTEVAVTLSEFGVELSRTDFQVGVQYHFVVTNDGLVPHEMMIMQPMEMNMDMDMAAMDELALAVFEEGDLLPGVILNQIVEFTDPGEMGFEAACHLPGHYEAGMVKTLTVTA